MKRWCIALLSGTGFLSGCVSSKGPTASDADARHLADLAARAQSLVVDRSDGISEAEAYKIACDYFFGGEFMACGVVSLPKVEKTVWRVPLFEGFVGIHTRDVVVEKTDGSYRIEAAIASPQMPNKAPEPTTLLVTPHADACVAPSRAVAHL